LCLGYGLVFLPSSIILLSSQSFVIPTGFILTLSAFIGNLSQVDKHIPFLKITLLHCDNADDADDGELLTWEDDDEDTLTLHYQPMPFS
jgi:hypothetical protein